MATSSERPALRADAIDRADLVASLYDTYQAELFGYLCRCCGQRDVAEEILQETFLRLIREVRAGRAPDQARPWLYRVATNLAASRGRHLAVLTRAQRWLRSVDVARSPERDVIQHESRDTLGRALAALAPDARRVVLLAAQGFDGIEIAHLVGRSEPATRSLLCRARKTLREILEAEEREP